MKIVVKIISYIFTFALMLSLFAGLVLGISTKTILDQQYILAKIEETNYYDKVYSDLIGQVEDYVEQSGLEGIEIQNVLRKEEVKTDINNLFTKLYNGEKISVNQSDVEQQLENNLEEEIEQKGIKLTTAEKKSVDKIIETVAKKYTTEVSYGTYSQYLDSVSKLISVVDKALFIVGMLLYVLPVILIGIILLFNYNQFRIGLKYLGISALSSGLLMIFLNLFTKFSMDIQNLFIFNKAISDLIIKVLSDLLGKINIAGLISVAVGVLFIIIGATYKLKKEENDDEEIEE